MLPLDSEILLTESASGVPRGEVPVFCAVVMAFLADAAVRDWWLLFAVGALLVDVRFSFAGVACAAHAEREAFLLLAALDADNVRHHAAPSRYRMSHAIA